MPDNDELLFFDCNTSYGNLNVPSLKYAPTTAALLAEMDHCGVDEALVTCAAQVGSPWDGNADLLTDIRQQVRLHPAWVLLPYQTGEIPEPAQFIAAMKAQGVRALWAWPGGHHYHLDEVTFGPLFEELIARSIPLFYRLTDAGDSRLGWAEVSRLLKEFPELTLVAADQSVWGEDHYFRPLVERYPNFYLETSHYELANGLVDFHNKYGPDRWLFGSAYPRRTMGGAVLQLANTELPLEARQAIAGGNLKRLLGEVKL